MDGNSGNPFYDPADRKFRRSNNSRSFWDDGPEPEPSPNNPFYDKPSEPKPGVYRRGGYNNSTTQNGTSNRNRRDLFGDENDAPPSKHLFDEDDDDFDVDAPFDAEAYRQKLLMKKIRESANRQMDSQHRSLAVIQDSEQMGIATAEALTKQGEQLDKIEMLSSDIVATLTPRAYSMGPLSHLTGGPVLVKSRGTMRGKKKVSESSDDADDGSSDESETDEELIRQGEQLDNVERKTASINKTMQTSEKHVNKLSSIFGGLKGWFSKKEPEEQETDLSGTRDSRLRDTVDAYRSTAPPVDHSQHPAVRLREQDRMMSKREHPPGQEPGMTTKQAFQQYDDQFNRNLDVMTDGLSRLKGLGLVLQTEIESQNEQVERINTQVARADDKVVQQTKRINNMLKK